MNRITTCYNAASSIGKSNVAFNRETEMLIKHSWSKLICLAIGLLSGPVSAQSDLHYSAPAGNRFAQVVPGGETVLPSGKLLTPIGQRLYTGENLWNVLLSPNGKHAVGLCGAGLVVYPVPSETGRNCYLLPWQAAAYCGAFTKDGSRLITSTGDAGHGIQVLSTAVWSNQPQQRLQRLQPEVLLSITANPEAYINDLALSPDERFVFGADVARQMVVVFDLNERKVIAELPAGREPFSLTLSPDGQRLYVANIGIFDYSLIPTGEGEARGLKVPAFGFPSREAEEGVEREGRKVPGLGSPHVVDAHSVWMLDVANPSAPKVSAQVKTGLLIQAPADRGKTVGGSSPNGLLATPDKLFVTNANNDTLQIFDGKTLTLQSTIKLAPEATLETLRGVIPTGMVATRDGQTLYVCAAGLNAVAVIDVAAGKVTNWIPTGWFPTTCRLSSDEQTLFVSTQKGLGRGPIGFKHKRAETDERFGLPDMPGMIAVVDLKKISAEGTKSVLANNGMLPQAKPARPIPEAIKHVVFITKENHTFDGIFGGLKGSTSEPEYAEFGMQGWIQAKGRAERLPIMPNHVRLAEQFAISDNFYMEPQASGDGHRWLVGIYPSFWTTRVFYSGWTFKKSETARGRMAAMGSNGSQIPEDYLENGSLWEHLARGGITFRNYGEGFEFPDKR